MGTFSGHLLPAMIFLLFSLYYSVLLSFALLRGQRFLKNPLPPRGKRGQRWWQVVPVEALAKVVLTMIGILTELFYPPGANRLKVVDWEDPRRPFLFKDNWHHVTMYGFFLVSGVVDIVSQTCQTRQSIKLERAAEALAFCVVALLMASHLGSKNALEVRTHVLFIVPTSLVSLSLLVEIWVPDQPVVWVVKVWMGLMLSNWMLQLAVLIYLPPSGQPWRSENPVDMAFVILFFCWHLGLAAALLGAIYGLCSLWYHRFSSGREAPETKYQLCPTNYSHEELEKLRADAQDPSV